MKKKYLFLLSTLSLFSLIGCNKNNEEYKLITKDCIKYLAFNTDEKVAMVVGYDAEINEEVTIPSSVDGYTVNAIRHESFVLAPITKITIPDTVAYIGYRSFAECLNLKEVSLQNSIETIYANTFANCVNLTSFNVPDSVTEIQTGAFVGCQNLSTIKFSSNLDTLGEYSLSYCTSLNNVDLSNTKIIAIENGTFYGCTSLNNIKFNNSRLHYLSSQAFASCTGLTSINLPDSLHSIGDETFYGCKGLDNIFIPKNVTYIGNNAFSKCKDSFKIMLEANELGALFSTNFNCYYPYVLGVNRDTKTTDIFVDLNNISYGINNYNTENPEATLFYPSDGFNTSLTLPDTIPYQESKTANVTSISDNAFIFNSKIESIDLSSASKFKTLGKYSFYGSNINSVTFNSELDSIGAYCFSNCYNLKNIDLSNSNKLTYIGIGSFYYDYNIETITLPSTESKIDIGAGAFYKCRQLNSITNLEKITNLSLYGYTFAECYNLGKDSSKPFEFTPNIKSITILDFFDWGTSGDQYIKINKDAYTTDGEGNVFLTCNDGKIKLEKVDDTYYKNNEYFYNAKIILEPKS